jgi:purine-binding chemotaxis protein CheW
MDKEPPAPAAQKKDFLEFNLKENLFIVPIEKTRQINLVGNITPIPNSAPFVYGVMNLRGQVIPIFDLNVRLGLGFSTLTRSTCVVVVESTEGLAGLMVDSVVRVISLSEDAFSVTPSEYHLPDRSTVESIAKDGALLYTLLNIKACLDPGLFDEVKVKERLKQQEIAANRRIAVKLLG